METTASKAASAGAAHPAAGLFSAYTGALQRLRLPGFNVSAIAESRRKDLAALATIHLALLDGLQAFSQKQAEVVRGTLAGLHSRLLEPGAAGDNAATGAMELTQGALQTSLANLRDLADIAQKTQADSVSAASKRIAENVEELKALFKPAQ